MQPYGLQPARLLCPWKFPRQEYCSELPCLPPGEFPGPGMEPTSLMSPALASGFFTTSATWKAHRLLGTNPITKQKYIIEKLGLEVSLFIFLPLDRKILYYFERKGKQYCPVHVFPFEMHSSSPIF